MMGIMANFYLFPYILHDKYENCLSYWTDKTHKKSTFLIKLQNLSPFLNFDSFFYIQVLGHFVTETTLMPSNWFSRAKMGPLFRSLLWAILCGIGKRVWPLLMLSNLLPEMWRMAMVTKLFIFHLISLLLIKFGILELWKPRWNFILPANWLFNVHNLFNCYLIPFGIFSSLLAFYPSFLFSYSFEM